MDCWPVLASLQRVYLVVYIASMIALVHANTPGPSTLPIYRYVDLVVVTPKLPVTKDGLMNSPCAIVSPTAPCACQIARLLSCRAAVLCCAVAVVCCAVVLAAVLCSLLCHAHDDRLLGFSLVALFGLISSSVGARYALPFLQSCCCCRI